MNNTRKTIVLFLSLVSIISSSTMCMDEEKFICTKEKAKRKKISTEPYVLLELTYDKFTAIIQKHPEEHSGKIITSAIIQDNTTEFTASCILPTPYHRHSIYTGIQANFSLDGSKFICAQYDETEETMYIPKLLISLLDLKNLKQSEWHLTYCKIPNIMEGITKKIAVSSDGKLYARLIESLKITPSTVLPIMLLKVNEFIATSTQRECCFEIDDSFNVTDLTFNETEKDVKGVIVSNKFFYRHIPFPIKKQSTQ